MWSIGWNIHHYQLQLCTQSKAILEIFTVIWCIPPPKEIFTRHSVKCLWWILILSLNFCTHNLHIYQVHMDVICAAKIPISLYCCCCLFRLFRFFSKIYLPCCRKTLIWLWSGWIGTFLILHTLFQWEVSCCCLSPMWWVQMAKRKNSLSPHQMLEVSSAGFNDIITRLRVQFLTIMTQ